MYMVWKGGRVSRRLSPWSQGPVFYDLERWDKVSGASLCLVLLAAGRWPLARYYWYLR